jgi:hypothetical protein
MTPRLRSPLILFLALIAGLCGGALLSLSTSGLLAR